MQIVKLVNGKFVAEEVKGNSNPGEKRHWYEIPDAQYQALLAVGKRDGLDLDAEGDRGRTVKENRAVYTIINLVLEEFLAKRQQLEAKGQPQTAAKTSTGAK